MTTHDVIVAGGGSAGLAAALSAAREGARTLLIERHTQLGGVGPVVANMVREAHGYKYHWAVADYLQRASRHIASKVDVQQAYAMGKAAVELAPVGHADLPFGRGIRDQASDWTAAHIEASLRQGIERGCLAESVLVVAAWVAVGGRRVGSGSGSGLSEEPALGV